ncbi:amidohydrolase [Saccharopolyspora sp. ASAGF58]|uniref:amidohydrolase family protein n=1 Tax=Saccharopolyspora sp. ASAGF58 TaxID=2719023 RepID=UPI0014468378|nr:amidohydrolase family protein [Saccharopolyspora sp. ASAGF58]
MTAPTRVIDTHLHVWRTNAPWMSWLDDRPSWWEPVRRDFSFAELREELDQAEVAELILVQAGTNVLETRQLLALAATEPSVRGVIGWTTLTSPEATARDLDSFTDIPGADRLVGIRNNHHWPPDGDVLADLRVIDSCRVLSDRGLTLDLHFEDDRELPLAVAIAERLPELTIVIDHLGKPRLRHHSAFATWAASMRRLAALPNVYVKYSGWATFVRRTFATDIQPYIDLVLDEFGSHRVMYGGNWPVALVAGNYRDTYRATLDAVAGRSDSEIENLLYSAAVTCYRLPQPSPVRSTT